MQTRYKVLAPHASASGSEATGDLGQGAYGVVYKALDTLTNTLVALKKMKVETQVDGISSSTLREITFLRQLKHDNVVVLRDVEMQTAGRISLIFELEDCDLSKLLSNSAEPFSEDTVQSYGAQIMSAVAYCHSMGVMHRDLKPQNILVSRSGRLKLADFGLARAIPPFPRPLTVEVITLWYRAPEVLLGHKYYSPSVDVWSAACIICEMSNRRVLFRGFKSDIDQIHTLFRLLGTPTPEVWPGLEDVPYWRQTFPDWPTRSVASLVPNMNPAGVDFVSRILRYNAAQRLTAKAALAHPYLRAHVQQATAASAMSRAARVTPLASQAGAYGAAQAQAGLSGTSGSTNSGGINSSLPTRPSATRVEVPTVSLFDSGAALASRCSSAVSFQLEDSQMSAPAMSENSNDSAALFQPIRSTIDLTASSTAPPSALIVAAPAELPAPKPLARSSSVSSSHSSGSQAPGPMLPRANRPSSRTATSAALSTTAVAATTSAVVPGSAVAVKSGVGVGGGNLLTAHLHAEQAPQLVSLPIPAEALTRVQVPVHSVSCARQAPALSSTSTTTSTTTNSAGAQGTTEKKTAARIRPVSVPPASAASAAAPASTSTTSTAAPRRRARIVTEEAAADQLEPAGVKIARLSTHSSTDSLLTADGGRQRGHSTDSVVSGLSVLNTALEQDLDSSLDWGVDDSQPDVPVAPCTTNTIAASAPASAAAVVAPAGSNKGRFNKRKFGSPLPASRPASTVMFAAPPATAVVTAPRVSRSTHKDADSAKQEAIPSNKLVRVTPDTVTSASAVSQELYWGVFSQASTPAGSAKAPVKVDAAVKKETVAAALPARRSTRHNK